MKISPIALFVYNRPEHALQCISALKQNDLASESHLYIFSDGAREGESESKVAAVRDAVKNINGFKRVYIIERDSNWGLAKNITEGVTQILNDWGRIIVLEDDLIPSREFLNFMNNALEKYENKSNIYSVTGYSYTDEIKNIDSSYFLSLASSWGWGTWQNRWIKFKRDDNLLRSYLGDKSRLHKFNYYGSFKYSEIAKKQLLGKINSWAIFWHAFILDQQGLTLFPAKRLIQNIGFDGSGTHCSIQLDELPPSENKVKMTEDCFEKSEHREILQKILGQKEINSFTSPIVISIRKGLPMSLKRLIKKVISRTQLLVMKKTIGEGTFVDKSVHVLGWKNISIGNNTLICEQGWLNVNHRSGTDKKIVIGNSCYLGRGCLLNSSKQIIVKDFVMTGSNCRLLASDHIFDDPFIPYINSGVSENETIIIGVNVWLGAGVTVVGNVSIGHGSIIGAGSVVTKDIPPFSIAVGNPCKVIKQYDFKLRQWIKVEKIDPENKILIPLENDYLTRLNNNQQSIVMPRVTSSHLFGDLP